MRNVRGALVLSIIAGLMIAGLGVVPCGAETGSGQAAASAQTAVQAADQTAASAIPADEQATKEQLTKLFEVMRVKQQMDSILKMMPALVQKQTQEQMKAIRAQLPASRGMSAKEQEELEQFQKRIMEKAMSAYPYDEMIGDMTEVYQRHVTRTDADAFIAFYSSPAGQHLLDAQPIIMKEYMPMVMKRVSERSKDLTDEIVKEAAELAKEFGTAPKATSAPQ